MDIYDKASEQEEQLRTSSIYVARRAADPTISLKRRRLADAREIAAQRGTNDPEVQQLGLECENGCGEQLTVHNDDIFCSKECAEDWHRRERIRARSGR